MKKLVGLQYLRAVAALAVVCFHAAGRVGMVFGLGESGVDLFFTLSGFLMIAITDQRTTPASFLADRIRRIVPAYWIATTVMLAGALAGLFPHVELQPWHVLSSYLFVPSRSPMGGHPWPLLVPGWTLNFEMMFYVVFAVLLFIRNERIAVAVTTLLFVTGAIVGTLHPFTSAIAVTYTDPIVIEFAAGAWLGVAWKREGRWHPLLGWPSILAAAVIFFLLRDHGAVGRDRFLLYGVPAFLLVLGTLTLERRRQCPIYRLPLLLGDASYSIYLWHMLTIPLVLKLLARVSPEPAVTMVIGILSGTLAGIAGYMLIERPIMRYWRERKFVRGAPVPAGP